MLNYFSVSIENSSAVFEEVSGVSTSRFTDANGATVDVLLPVSYLSRSWVTSRLPWMEPLPVTERAMVLSKLDFLNLFTSAERIAIMAAANTDATVKDVLFIFNNTDQIDLSKDQTVGAVKYFALLNLISAQRVSEILGIS